nr:hypothetical protein RSP673_08775 [Ralstonia solanacearum P673]
MRHQALMCRSAWLNVSSGSAAVSCVTGKAACRDRPCVEPDAARDAGGLASPLNSAGRAAWRLAAGGLAAALVLADASTETGGWADSRMRGSLIRPPAMVFLRCRCVGLPVLW